MAELIVRRRAAWWQDRMRDYIVLVDGSECGRVGNDAEVRVHVAPGRHRVQLKIDWCGSPAVDVDVPEGATQVLDCGPNAMPLTAIFYVIFRTGHYLTLQPGARHDAAPDLRDPSGRPGAVISA
ncbi:hypothetical protein C5614_22205 [Massilia phosphatilytica]|nr:hypothetical protein C5614_22205 [Massilia phosphatilytica]